eukprot:TRINITY_DN35653_c0_g1_i1.p1 TRINITY_DN35653_c0_g1~~TRINITY_DN35653_c0_g1_i1.p1  ORF type:complete len:2875 (-),score=560.22 TRINITY_DN35653_c0_g1_i1:202-8826(-)
MLEDADRLLKPAQVQRLLQRLSPKAADSGSQAARLQVWQETLDELEGLLGIRNLQRVIHDRPPPLAMPFRGQQYLQGCCDGQAGVSAPRIQASADSADSPRAGRPCRPFSTMAGAAAVADSFEAVRKQIYSSSWGTTLATMVRFPRRTNTRRRGSLWRFCDARRGGWQIDLEFSEESPSSASVLYSRLEPETSGSDPDTVSSASAAGQPLRSGGPPHDEVCLGSLPADAWMPLTIEITVVSAAGKAKMRLGCQDWHEVELGTDWQGSLFPPPPSDGSPSSVVKSQLDEEGGCQRHLVFFEGVEADVASLWLLAGAVGEEAAEWLQASTAHPPATCVLGHGYLPNSWADQTRSSSLPRLSTMVDFMRVLDETPPARRAGRRRTEWGACGLVQMGGAQAPGDGGDARALESYLTAPGCLPTFLWSLAAELRRRGQEQGESSSEFVGDVQQLINRTFRLVACIVSWLLLRTSDADGEAASANGEVAASSSAGTACGHFFVQDGGFAIWSYVLWRCIGPQNIDEESIRIFDELLHAAENDEMVALDCIAQLFGPHMLRFWCRTTPQVERRVWRLLYELTASKRKNLAFGCDSFLEALGGTVWLQESHGGADEGCPEAYCLRLLIALETVEPKNLHSLWPSLAAARRWPARFARVLLRAVTQIVLHDIPKFCLRDGNEDWDHIKAAAYTLSLLCGHDDAGVCADALVGLWVLHALGLQRYCCTYLEEGLRVIRGRVTSNAGAAGRQGEKEEEANNNEEIYCVLWAWFQNRHPPPSWGSSDVQLDAKLAFLLETSAGCVPSWESCPEAVDVWPPDRRIGSELLVTLIPFLQSRGDRTMQCRFLQDFRLLLGHAGTEAARWSALRQCQEAWQPWLLNFAAQRISDEACFLAAMKLHTTVMADAVVVDGKAWMVLQDMVTWATAQPEEEATINIIVCRAFLAHLFETLGMSFDIRLREAGRDVNHPLAENLVGLSSVLHKYFTSTRSINPLNLQPHLPTLWKDISQRHPGLQQPSVHLRTLIELRQKTNSPAPQTGAVGGDSATSTPERPPLRREFTLGGPDRPADGSFQPHTTHQVRCCWLDYVVAAYFVTLWGQLLRDPLREQSCSSCSTAFKDDVTECPKCGKTRGSCSVLAFDLRTWAAPARSTWSSGGRPFPLDGTTEQLLLATTTEEHVVNNHLDGNSNASEQQSERRRGSEENNLYLFTHLFQWGTRCMMYSPPTEKDVAHEAAKAASSADFLGLPRPEKEKQRCEGFAAAAFCGCNNTPRLVFLQKVLQSLRQCAMALLAIGSHSATSLPAQALHDISTAVVSFCAHAEALQDFCIPYKEDDKIGPLARQARDDAVDVLLLVVLLCCQKWGRPAAGLTEVEMRECAARGQFPCHALNLLLPRLRLSNVTSDLRSLFAKQPMTWMRQGPAWTDPLSTIQGSLLSFVSTPNGGRRGNDDNAQGRNNGRPRTESSAAQREKSVRSQIAKGWGFREALPASTQAASTFAFFETHPEYAAKSQAVLDSRRCVSRDRSAADDDASSTEAPGSPRNTEASKSSIPVQKRFQDDGWTEVTEADASFGGCRSDVDECLVRRIGWSRRLRRLRRSWTVRAWRNLCSANRTPGCLWHSNDVWEHSEPPRGPRIGEDDTTSEALEVGSTVPDTRDPTTRWWEKSFAGSTAATANLGQQMRRWGVSRTGSSSGRRGLLVPVGQADQDGCCWGSSSSSSEGCSSSASSAASGASRAGRDATNSSDEDDDDDSAGDPDGAVLFRTACTWVRREGHYPCKLQIREEALELLVSRGGENTEDGDSREAHRKRRARRRRRRRRFPLRCLSEEGIHPRNFLHRPSALDFYFLDGSAPLRLHFDQEAKAGETAEQQELRTPRVSRSPATSVRTSPGAMRDEQPSNVLRTNTGWGVLAGPASLRSSVSTTTREEMSVPRQSGWGFLGADYNYRAAASAASAFLPTLTAAANAAATAAGFGFNSVVDDEEGVRDTVWLRVFQLLERRRQSKCLSFLEQQEIGDIAAGPRYSSSLAASPHVAADDQQARYTPSPAWSFQAGCRRPDKASSRDEAAWSRRGNKAASRKPPQPARSVRDPSSESLQPGFMKRSTASLPALLAASSGRGSEEESSPWMPDLAHSFPPVRLSDLQSLKKNYENQMKQHQKELLARWRRGEISNFSYLHTLNLLSGRSMEDLSQYPVMPWLLQKPQHKDPPSEVLARGDEEELAAYFRDLARTLGDLGSGSRRAMLLDKYDLASDMDQPPYHYGTHYSTPAFVMHFLVRLQPFSSLACALQGGRHDIADRIFGSMTESWRSCTHEVSDVRELIPEFFVLPEFFVNVNKLNFGRRQDKTLVHHVELYTWARDAYHLIHEHRLALESSYVSSTLHQWIDLVWGCRQSGPAAQDALNVFYPLTYGCEWSTIEPEHRHAQEQQVLHFGQTPVQLFAQPHPARDTEPSRPSLTFFLDKEKADASLRSWHSSSVGVALRGQSHLASSGYPNPVVCLGSYWCASMGLLRLYALQADGTLRWYRYRQQPTMEAQVASSAGVLGFGYGQNGPLPGDCTSVELSYESSAPLFGESISGSASSSLNWPSSLEHALVDHRLSQRSSIWAFVPERRFFARGGLVDGSILIGSSGGGYAGPETTAQPIAKFCSSIGGIKSRRALGVAAPVTALAVSQEASLCVPESCGLVILSGTADGQLSLWSAADDCWNSFTCVARWQIHTAAVRCVDFAGSVGLLGMALSCSDDGRVQMLRLRSPMRPERSFLFKDRLPVAEARFGSRAPATIVACSKSVPPRVCVWSFQGYLLAAVELQCCNTLVQGLRVVSESDAREGLLLSFTDGTLEFRQLPYLGQIWSTTCHGHLQPTSLDSSPGAGVLWLGLQDGSFQAVYGQDGAP